MTDETNDETTNPRDIEGFLATARHRFHEAAEAERKIRDEARIDIRYLAGQQWDDNVLMERRNSGRPALTFNKLPTFVQSIANEARQNKPQPSVNPISGGASAEVAKVLNGIIRHVQYRSKADVAYDTALEYAASGSFGYFRFLTEYCDDESEDQELTIKPVFDPFSIYGVLLPACMGKPCPWAFVIERMPKTEFKIKYPNAEATSIDFQGDLVHGAGDWFGTDDVMIAEYWHVETKRKKNKAGRDILVHTVKQCVINGIEVLDDSETEWLGDSIPIVPVLGKQLIVDGEVKIFSLVRFLRDPQQLFNFYKSGIAEKIALGNRVPYIGYEGQFTDPKWKDANTKNYPYLEAKGVMLNGALAPLPQRQQFEEQIQALSVAAGQESDDMKAIAGIFDASLGSQGNETSGIGIQKRQQQSNITNLHFSDNLNRAEWEGCLIMLQVIPKIYDKPGRQVRIVGEDETQSVITVNQPYRDPESGMQKHYPLDRGKYDVVVTTGPSYTTARQEGAETLGQVFKAVPTVFPILGDLWVGSMDYPWSEEGARRLKAMLPPQVQSEEQGAQQIPPAVQQHVAQLEQQLQQAHAFAQSLHEQMAAKVPEIQSKMEIATMHEEMKRVIAFATLDARDGLALLQGDLEAVKHRLDMIGDAHMQQATQDHAIAMQRGDQQHQVAQQQDAQAHQGDMAGQAQDAAAQGQQSDQEHQASMADQAQQAAAQMPKAA